MDKIKKLEKQTEIVKNDKINLQKKILQIEKKKSHEIPFTIKVVATDGTITKESTNTYTAQNPSN